MDDYFMNEALKLAKQAFDEDEVPVGCIITYNQEIIGKGYNQREQNQSSVDHAEIIAIQQACKSLGSWRLEECTLYVTLEPCAMCAGAIIQSRMKRVVFGASDPKGGSFGSTIDLTEVPGYNHYPEVIPGIRAKESKALLQSFFKIKRLKQ
jgi:tRNA(adenine34) deaminase